MGADGLLEIKCPMPHTHIGYLLGEGINKDYKPQIQGQLYVCERQWLDSLSYCPPLPPKLVRIQRDEKYIVSLAEALTVFVEQLDKYEAKLRAMIEPEPMIRSSANQQVWDDWRPTV